MEGALNLGEFVRLLRTRWIIVCVTVAVAVSGAVAITMLTTPLYKASTKLYVSTTASASGSGNDDYQGVMAAQQRVHSYTKLLDGPDSGSAHHRHTTSWA